LDTILEKLRKLRKDFNMRVKLERNIGKKERE
jgi:hypothetical protein